MATASSTSILLHSSIGLAWAIVLYGIYGSIMTFLRLIRLGSKRFFRRVDRSTPPPRALDSIYGTHEMIKLKSSGMSLHYVSKGVPNQPMILFLHGFLECWYSWRNQMKHFSKNYRVVAIDQRGYGLSSKAPFVYDYRIEALAGDVADVIEQLGYESCVLVGHDMGGMVAWATAMLYPHLVEKLVVLNCPHPLAFRQDITVPQVRRSWYMFFSQVPAIPELSLLADDLAMIDEAFRTKGVGLVHKENITDDDIEVYKYTLSQSKTPHAAFNFYRAFHRYPTDLSRTVVIAPVLLLWGCQDPVLSEELADMSKAYCGDIRVVKIAGSSHWINQDVPAQVNRQIELFLAENPETEYTYEN